MSTTAMILAAAAGGTLTAVPSGVMTYLGVRRMRTAHQHTQDELELARYDATHDALTGLVSRGAFYAQGNQLLTSAAKDWPLAVVIVDVNDFKQVNDTYGHGVGDVVLIAIAHRLRDVVPDGLVARLSGDEFAVVVPMRRGESAETIGGALADASDSPIVVPVNLPDDLGDEDDRVREVELSMTWSVGVEDVRKPTPLFLALAHADAAMYAAKRDRSLAAVRFDAVRHDHTAPVPGQRPATGTRTRELSRMDPPVAAWGAR